MRISLSEKRTRRVAWTDPQNHARTQRRVREFSRRRSANGKPPASKPETQVRFLARRSKFRSEAPKACGTRALRIAGRRGVGCSAKPALRHVALLNRVLACDPAKLMRLAPSTRNRLLAHAYAQAGYARARA